MKQVLIVDDEKLTVEGLRLLVNWKSYDAEVCAVAFDGTTALQKIKMFHPDIVFTDIRMPGMNGLELIQQAKKEFPDTIFIIISGYNDFEYIRKALRFGVTDYVDKPASVEKIDEVMRHISTALAERDACQQKFGISKWKTKIKQIMEQLIMRKSVSEQDVLLVEEQNNNYLAGDEFFLTSAIEFSDLSTELETCLEKWCMQLSHAGLMPFVFPDGKNKYLLVVLQKPARSTLENLMKSTFGSYTEVTECMISVGIGNAYHGFLGFLQSVKEARRALEYAKFFDEPLAIAREIEYQTFLPTELLGYEADIAFYMRMGDRKEVLHQVRDITAVFLKNNLSPELFCHECLQMVYLGLTVCRETGEDFLIEQKSVFLPHIEIQRCMTLTEIALWVEDVFAQMLDWMEQKKARQSRKTVYRAKEYIDLHYQEPITLGMLSEMSHMYPTYFSVVFKEQFGKTYVKYLNEVRMNQAKTLLCETSMKVKEVSAQVGYLNDQYFCNKFKSYYGCTPEQFRLSKKERENKK